MWRDKPPSLHLCFTSSPGAVRAQPGANNHKVFRSLCCLVSHANKMGKTAEQVHNLDLNLQLVSPLVNRYFIYAYRTFMRGSLQLKRQRINY